MCATPNILLNSEPQLSKKTTEYLFAVRFLNILSCVGRDSSVGIATRYGSKGTKIESQGGADFSHLFQPTLGPTQPPIKWVPALFPGGKTAGTRS
jgi:hypothetical protein